MPPIALFGAAGAIGQAVARELNHRAVPFRAVGRDRSRLERAFAGFAGAEIFPADVGDPHGAADAARGVETIIYSVGVPYPAFHLHPRLMRITVEAAASVQVQRLVVASSVYSYGVPETRRVAETHPRLPETRKGRFRKEQEDIALEAQARGLIDALVVRLPDFYGPHADNSLANPILRAALAGRTATWLGPASTPHEFLFVPDAGPLIVELAHRPDCFGEAWNFGGPGEITGGEFIQKAYLAAGREPRFRSVGRAVLRVGGWFNPLLKELVEMTYLQETPVILDDSKLRRRLGSVHKTPYDEGIRRTLEWMGSSGR